MLGKRKSDYDTVTGSGESIPGAEEAKTHIAEYFENLYLPSQRGK